MSLRDVPLAPYTTLALGGPAAHFVEATTDEEVVEALRGAPDPVLILGGGSNLVIADAGFPGTVVHIGTRGIVVDGSTVRAQAGEEWDPFVARCLDEGLAGVECLSGIPGRLGATPIQNVGAYGQEVADTIRRVRVYDRHADEVAELRPDQCAFGYRTSIFKEARSLRRSDRGHGKGNDRYVVLAVTYELDRSESSGPIGYAELARRLGVEVGARVPAKEARGAVLELRRGKGMVLDPADPDTHSAGSFFTNPILDTDQAAALERRVAERLGPGGGFPRHPEPDGRIKTSAAWLIDKAGFAKGYGRGAARISTKHTLALTNPGAATTADLLDLAREVRDGVEAAFGVTLVNEPVFVGVTL